MNGAAEIFGAKAPAAAPLPESLADWPGAAIEFVVCLNRMRRAKTPSHLDNETARESIAHARAWWKHSTAYTWPERGKKGEALRDGIEGGLLSLNRLRARLIREGGGGAIVAPAEADENDLRQALTALGLDHLRINRTARAEGLAA